MSLEDNRILNKVAENLAPFTENCDIPVDKREEMVSEVMNEFTKIIKKMNESKNKSVDVYECLECNNTFLRGRRCPNPDHKMSLFKIKLSN